MISKIVSGGQTGADRAALDAAIECEFPHAGYCPQGRMAEDGVIDESYSLVEIDGGYRQRTKMNVVESDGTAIFYQSVLQGGTEQTLVFCIRSSKPYKLIDIDLIQTDIASVVLGEFIDTNKISVLNVAGPRHSSCPRVYEYVKKTIKSTILKST